MPAAKSGDDEMSGRICKYHHQQGVNNTINKVSFKVIFFIVNIGVIYVNFGDEHLCNKGHNSGSKQIANH